VEYQRLAGLELVRSQLVRLQLRVVAVVVAVVVAAALLVL
jgi:hypothetical protein